MKTNEAGNPIVTLCGQTVELTKLKVAQPEPQGACERAGPFVFGEPVECKTYGDEWLDGFFFLAHVPQLSRPYLVRGRIEGYWCSEPPRLHAECRRAPVQPTAA